MSAIAKYEYEEFYKEYEKQRHRDFMVSLSANISFKSNTWIYERRLQNQAQLLSKVTIYFTKVSEKYKEMVKYYTLICLLEGKGVSTVRGNVGNAAVFLNFIGGEPCYHKLLS